MTYFAIRTNNKEYRDDFLGTDESLVLESAAERAASLLANDDEEPVDYSLISSEEILEMIGWKVEQVTYPVYAFLEASTADTPYVDVPSHILEEKPIFLLGGGDAEMHTIREELIKAKAKFIDLALGWGAKLSDYSQFLNKDDWFIAIELTEDIQGFYNVEFIDHHGERSNEHSSLEQVLNLLYGPKYELTTWQQLVAANDVAHIEGMMLVLGYKPGSGINATTPGHRALIQEVRALDRMAQGVSGQDEQAAEKALATRLPENTPAFGGVGYTKIGETHVVFAETDKTSTVTDRLMTSQNILVLSTSGEFNFFGDARISRALAEEFKGWSGGKDLQGEGQSSFAGGYAPQSSVWKSLKQLLS